MSVKLDMHFIHSTTREIQIYFASCMANSKRKFKLLCAKLVWNTSRYKWLYVCLFVFMVLFCSSCGSRSEWPRALQLLIKMLIRLCLKWEGLFFLYFYMQNSLKLAKPLSVRLMKYSNRNPWSISYLSINIFMPRLLHHLTTERANWSLNLHRFGNKKIEFLVSLTTRQY